MSTIVLCDEESLTKFEISAIHILFEELDPEFLLKHATATFLADLYHLSYIQRKFLLNELTTNFLRLPTKRPKLEIIEPTGVQHPGVYCCRRQIRSRRVRYKCACPGIGSASNLQLRRYRQDLA